MLSDVKLCVANKDGSFQGCGAPLPRAGTPEAHLDHTNECSKRICPSCSTAVGEHYPGCASPWKES